MLGLIKFSTEEGNRLWTLILWRLKKVGSVIGGICVHDLNDVGMTPTSGKLRLQLLVLKGFNQRHPTFCTQLPARCSSRQVGKDSGLWSLGSLLPPRAGTALVTGHVRGMEGSVQRHRHQVSPGESCLPAWRMPRWHLPPLSLFWIILQSPPHFSTALGMRICLFHLSEDVKRPWCPGCLGVHGHASVFRQKSNSKGSRNGSKSLL